MKVKVGDEGGHVGVLLLEAFPFTFQDVDEPVPEVQESVTFLNDQETNVLHRAIQETGMRFCRLWVTRPTFVPIASVELVGSVGVWVIPVDRIPRAGYMMLAVVLGMLNSLPV